MPSKHMSLPKTKLNFVVVKAPVKLCRRLSGYVSSPEGILWQSRMATEHRNISRLFLGYTSQPCLTRGYLQPLESINFRAQISDPRLFFIHSAKAGGGHPVILDLWPLMAGDFYIFLPGNPWWSKNLWFIETI